ncbi:bis(5'-adenosyl)-triphosphatase-like [Oscarella lobularis]|uniref:bis(5'-adenosyl)-triphosphatase-like n=1 Tax=Oscarella lobularis TaxID=121494 RepID=UPI003313B215
MSVFRFGQHLIRTTQIFFQSDLSVAFVNIKPVVRGHVLVSPKRLVKRFKDLSRDEITDLFVSTQIIAEKIESAYKGTSCTIAIQDGPDAGQTVNHVHVHILPRKPGDFEENDQIYSELNAHSKSVALDSTRSDRRTEEDMGEEAASLAKLFVSTK